MHVPFDTCVREDSVACETTLCCLILLLGRYLVRNSDGSLSDVSKALHRREFFLIVLDFVTRRNIEICQYNIENNHAS